MPKKREQIPFVLPLAIGQTMRLTEDMHMGGFIKQVTIHWPDGSDALVDVMVGHDIVQFCPREGYLALNDATPTYEFNEPVGDNVGIWVEARNRDGGNPHEITATVIVEGLA